MLQRKLKSLDNSFVLWFENFEGKNPNGSRLSKSFLEFPFLNIRRNGRLLNFVKLIQIFLKTRLDKNEVD